MRIGRIIGAGKRLRANHDWLHGLGLEDCATAFEGGDGDFLVTGIKEPVGTYKGVCSSVVGGDRDVATRKGGDEGDEGRRIILTVFRRIAQEIAAVAGVTVKAEELNVRPVGTEG